MEKISCITAAENAFHRTGDMLFRPFRFKYWLLLGLGAWLTLFGENGTPMFTGNMSDKLINPLTIENTFHLFAAGKWDEALTSMGIPFGIQALLIILCCAGVFMVCWWLLVAWIKAQGNFLYLDLIVKQENTTIKESFLTHLRQGNSAFWWKLVVCIICTMLSAVAFLLPLILTEGWIRECIATATLNSPSDMAICGMVLSGCCGITMLLLTALVMFFFYQFIIPLMYLGKMKALDASMMFLRLLMARPLPFVKYLLLIIALKVCLGIAIILTVTVVILITCCLALIPLSVIYVLLILPYTWAVVTLPLLLFFRLCSLELLDQMKRQGWFELPPENTEKQL